MGNYTAPELVLDRSANDISLDVLWMIFFVPTYIAILYYGGSWGWCQATCGWGRVAECTNSWGQIKAVCRR